MSDYERPRAMADAVVEQATANPGEKRHGVFRLRGGPGPRFDVPTLDGVPLKRVRKVTIEADVNGVAQVTVEFVGVPVDFEGIVDVTGLGDPHKKYEQRDA